MWQFSYGSIGAKLSVFCHHLGQIYPLNVLLIEMEFKLAKIFNFEFLVFCVLKEMYLLWSWKLLQFAQVVHWLYHYPFSFLHSFFNLLHVVERCLSCVKWVIHSVLGFAHEEMTSVDQKILLYMDIERTNILIINFVIWFLIATS